MEKNEKFSGAVISTGDVELLRVPAPKGMPDVEFEIMASNTALQVFHSLTSLASVECVVFGRALAPLTR